MTTTHDLEHRALIVPAGAVSLPADIDLPADARGIVLFAHGSGSSRHSPRNRQVARALNDAAIATILIDLLSEEEEIEDARTAALRFDIRLLTRRLISVTNWIERDESLSRLSLGYFGASTGAAAALAAAAERPSAVCAVVARGGRPDLAGSALRSVAAPSLFIVGGDDHIVLRLNGEAILDLPRSTPARLEVIPGATHLFEEPGALERVAELATCWFQRYLAPAG
jgi:dienelactone hydrolase